MEQEKEKPREIVCYTQSRDYSRADVLEALWDNKRSHKRATTTRMKKSKGTQNVHTPLRLLLVQRCMGWFHPLRICTCTSFVSFLIFSFPFRFPFSSIYSIILCSAGCWLAASRTMACTLCTLYSSICTHTMERGEKIAEKDLFQLQTC